MQGRSGKAQSAMEYLMTYGWAILLVAVVLAVLFQLGVFNSSTVSGSGCLSEVGFLCTSQVMNTLGYLSVDVGQIGQGTVTLTGINCSSSSQAPTNFQTESLSLASSETTNLLFECPLSSQQLGSYFTGYLWLKYTNSQGQTIIIQAATIKAQAITAAGLGPAAPAQSSQYIYCVDDAGNSYSSQILSNGLLTSWTTQNGFTLYGLSNSNCGYYSGTLYCEGQAEYGSSTAYGFTEYTAASGGVISPWSMNLATNVIVENPGESGAGPAGTVGVDSCTFYNGYMYCVGGNPDGTMSPSVDDNSVEYSAVTSGGFSGWSYTAANYPIDNDFENCFSYSGYVYCIGGYTNGSPNPTNAVYSAQASGDNTGLGAFTKVGQYPYSPGVESEGCTVAGSYVYCMGGGVDGYSNTNEALSAPLSGGGAIGAFTDLTSNSPLPTGAEAYDCVYANNNNIYCLAGDEAITAVYNSVVGSGGTLGTWSTQPKAAPFTTGPVFCGVGS